MEFDTDQTMPQVRQVVEQANKAALHSYLPKPYSGRVVLARSAKTFTGFDLERQGWVEFAPNLESHTIPESGHLELMTEPHIARLAEILTRSIEKAGLSSGAM